MDRKVLKSLCGGMFLSPFFIKMRCSMASLELLQAMQSPTFGQCVCMFVWDTGEISTFRAVRISLDWCSRSEVRDGFGLVRER